MFFFLFCSHPISLPLESRIKGFTVSPSKIMFLWFRKWYVLMDYHLISKTMTMTDTCCLFSDRQKKYFIKKKPGGTTLNVYKEGQKPIQKRKWQTKNTFPKPELAPIISNKDTQKNSNNRKIYIRKQPSP